MAICQPVCDYVNIFTTGTAVQVVDSITQDRLYSQGVHHVPDTMCWIPSVKPRGLSQEPAYSDDPSFCYCSKPNVTGQALNVKEEKAGIWVFPEGGETPSSWGPLLQFHHLPNPQRLWPKFIYVQALGWFLASGLFSPQWHLK